MIYKKVLTNDSKLEIKARFHSCTAEGAITDEAKKKMYRAAREHDKIHFLEAWSESEENPNVCFFGVFFQMSFENFGPH